MRRPKLLLPEEIDDLYANALALAKRERDRRNARLLAQFKSAAASVHNPRRKRRKPVIMPQPYVPPPGRASIKIRSQL